MSRSFLWSQVRDPTRRAISHYFYKFVSNLGFNASDDKLFKEVAKRELGGIMLKNWVGITGEDNPAAKIRKIFRTYDFFGLKERFEESTVILQLLLELKPRNVLYMSSKIHGGINEAACRLIQPAVLTPGMNEFLASPEWIKLTFWDSVLVKAVNASLDLTIDALGRTEFEKHLNEFRRLRTEMEQACENKTRMPCSADGKLQDETDCLFRDMGCGFDCMDAELAKRGIAGPLLVPSA